MRCRAVRVAGDVVVTGSDDWTARVWTLNDGECEATVACHAGPVTAVDYVTASRGFITGSADCTVRLWDRGDGECNLWHSTAHDQRLGGQR
ncbi:unnamed protein product, partial [Closterium sp. NIES-53]